MIVIHVDDETDLKIKFISLVGKVMTHVRNSDLYNANHGSAQKKLRTDSLERIRQAINELHIEKVDDSQWEKTPHLVIDSAM